MEWGVLLLGRPITMLVEKREHFDGNWYSTVQEQSQIMSQNQIQSLQILAMDNMELNEYLQNEYLENPLLEYVSASEAGREDRNGMETVNGTGITRVSDHTSTESYKAWNDGTKEYDVASENPLELKYYLLDQINQLKYTVAENKVMEFLIDCLDPSGFFTMSTQDVARMTNTSEETVEKCLDIMSNLKPDGIFATDLAHCLIHQLEVLGRMTNIFMRLFYITWKMWQMERSVLFQEN